MREIAELMPLVVPFAPSCPEPTAVHWLRWAAAEFCKATRVWREERRFDVIGGLDEQFCMPEYAAIHEIEHAWFNGSLLRAIGYGSTVPTAQDALPHFLTQTAPDTLRLAPGALDRGELLIHVFLKPSTTAEDLPDFLVDHYSQEIADGALSRILLLPNQPFSSPDMGMAYAQAFQMAKDKNFNANMRGQQRAPVRTRSRYL